MRAENSAMEPRIWKNMRARVVEVSIALVEHVATSNVARRYAFPTEVALPTTYLNELALDHARGGAYLVDAGGGEPHGLIRDSISTPARAAGCCTTIRPCELRCPRGPAASS